VVTVRRNISRATASVSAHAPANTIDKERVMDRFAPYPAILSVIALVSLPSSSPAQSSGSMIGGWLKTQPTEQQMLQGQDPAKVQEFMQANAAVQKNPKTSPRS
jgi:hypothetical protein